MTTCSVCTSGRVEEIDAAITARMGYARLARQFGLHKDAVRRHNLGGHVVLPPKAPAGVASAPGGLPATPAPSGDPLSDLMAQRDALDAVDMATLSPAMSLQFYAERRRTAEAIAKMSPAALVEPVSVKELRAMEEMSIVVLDVIERYPHVRAEVAAALVEWKENREQE